VRGELETVATGDIGATTEWAAALEGVDAVVHLAARVHMTKETIEDPDAAYRRVNSAGTARLAGLAASAGVRRFVYLSSVKIHGEGRETPYREDDPPSPRDAYGISKWEAEQALRSYGNRLEPVVLRPPLVYGPGVRANFLQLLRLVRRQVPLPLASVRNRRSLVYVGNLADAVTACLTHPDAARQTFLVSDGEDVSTPDLVRRLAVALGRSARLFPFPPSVVRAAARLLGCQNATERLLGSLTVDSSRIRAALGWTCPYTMFQGLKITADWHIASGALGRRAASVAQHA
jgi:nucleoside-diphosphate-sugar epimerase